MDERLIYPHSHFDWLSTANHLRDRSIVDYILCQCLFFIKYKLFATFICVFSFCLSSLAIAYQNRSAVSTVLSRIIVVLISTYILRCIVIVKITDKIIVVIYYKSGRYVIYNSSKISSIMH